MTKEAADEWVGATIWQIDGDGRPIAYKVIGAGRRRGFAAHDPNRFCLDLLRDEPAEAALEWEQSAPAFRSPDLAREYTLTREDRARFEKIERAAYARRGFGVAPRPRVAPLALDLFTFAAEMATRRARTDPNRPGESRPAMGAA